MFSLAPCLLIGQSVPLITGDVVPGAEWQQVKPEAVGYSSAKLEALRGWVRTQDTSAMMVVVQGRVIFSYGDMSHTSKVASVRKSVLAMLYGNYVFDGKIDLNKTVKELGLDDRQPFLPIEEHATLEQLLASRSGIYLPTGSSGQKDYMPPRGSEYPGIHFVYNNWDFNALGSIFEKEFKTPIAKAFDARIAQRIGMQDFRVEDMYYLHAPADASPDFNKSIHPAYHFRMTARDLARFGYLFLRNGEWQGESVVPKAWVSDSTRAHSQPKAGEGYGYLWWVDGSDLPVGSFSAQGALAKYVVVLPARDLVVVYLNHTEFPDDASGLTADAVKKLPSISHDQMGQILKMLLDAQPRTPM